MSTPNSMRSLASEKKYQDDKAKGLTKDLLDEPAIKEWHGWRLIENAYPYDLIYKTHHMLIPIDRTASEMGVRDLRLKHFILPALSEDYDLWFVNMPHRQSIRSILHIHLVSYKDREAALKDAEVEE